MKQIHKIKYLCFIKFSDTRVSGTRVQCTRVHTHKSVYFINIFKQLQLHMVLYQIPYMVYKEYILYNDQWWWAFIINYFQ